MYYVQLREFHAYIQLPVHRKTQYQQLPSSTTSSHKNGKGDRAKLRSVAPDDLTSVLSDAFLALLVGQSVDDETTGDILGIWRALRWAIIGRERR